MVVPGSGGVAKLTYFGHPCSSGRGNCVAHRLAITEVKFAPLGSPGSPRTLGSIDVVGGTAIELVNRVFTNLDTKTKDRDRPTAGDVQVGLGSAGSDGAPSERPEKMDSRLNKQPPPASPPRPELIGY